MSFALWLPTRLISRDKYEKNEENLHFSHNLAIAVECFRKK